MGHPLALFPSPPPAFAMCQRCKEVLAFPVWVCSEEHVECMKCYMSTFACCVCGTDPTLGLAGGAFEEASFLGDLVDELPLTCGASGCDWKGKVSSKKEHDAECKHAITLCPNGCGLELLVKDVRAHRRSTCPLQKLACRRGIINGEKRCIYLRKDTKNHDDVCCYFECPVADCPTMGPRRMIESHTEECSVVHATLNDATEEIYCLEQALEEQRLEHDELVEQVEGHEEEMKDYEESLTTAQGEMYTVAKRLEELEQHLGLAPTVQVDDEFGSATLISTASASTTQATGFNLRRVEDPTSAQIDLYQRLVESFEAKKAVKVAGRAEVGEQPEKLAGRQGA